MSLKSEMNWGSSCGTIGRAVTCDPRFESSIRQCLFTVDFVEKTIIRKDRPEMVTNLSTFQVTIILVENLPFLILAYTYLGCL